MREAKTAVAAASRAWRSATAASVLGVLVAVGSCQTADHDLSPTTYMQVDASLHGSNDDLKRAVVLLSSERSADNKPFRCDQSQKCLSRLSDVLNRLCLSGERVMKTDPPFALTVLEDLKRLAPAYWKPAPGCITLRENETQIAAAAKQQIAASAAAAEKEQVAAAIASEREKWFARARPVFEKGDTVWYEGLMIGPVRKHFESVCEQKWQAEAITVLRKKPGNSKETGYHFLCLRSLVAVEFDDELKREFRQFDEINGRRPPSERVSSEEIRAMQRRAFLKWWRRQKAPCPKGMNVVSEEQRFSFPAKEIRFDVAQGYINVECRSPETSDARSVCSQGGPSYLMLPRLREYLNQPLKEGCIEDTCLAGMPLMVGSRLDTSTCLICPIGIYDPKESKAWDGGPLCKAKKGQTAGK